MQYCSSRSQETIAICPQPASKQQQQQPRAMNVLTPRTNALHVSRPYPAGIESVPSRLKALDERRVRGCPGCENVRIGFPGYRLRQCGQHHGSGGAPSERSGAALRTSPARAHSKNAARAESKPEKQDERRVRGCPGCESRRFGLQAQVVCTAPRQQRVHSTTAAAAHRALRGGPGTVCSQDAHLRHGSSRCSAFSPSSGVLRLVAGLGHGALTDRPVLSLTVHTRGDSLRC
jgi:hypothetical protein